MTAPQMTALSAFCFIAVVFLVAPLISCKGNKNQYLVNISHCVGHPDRREERAGEWGCDAGEWQGAGGLRQRRKECKRENPRMKGSFLGFHLVDSLWLSENVVR